jgi:hypothetical protein
MRKSAVAIVLVVMTTSCGSGDEGASSAKPSAATSSPAAPKPSSTPVTSASEAPPPKVEGKPPADGKYERVTVEGTTVPMIEVMESGTVVLVDTDGKKPRTWEEQYKKKRADLGVGTFDIHKVDANKNNKFDDDPIDKEGLWVIDEKGNLTKH